jgi:hypothetical protein
MALVGLDIAGTKQWTSPRDSAKGTPEATVFTLGTLTGRQRMYLKDSAIGFQSDDTQESGMSMSFKSNQTAYEVVRLGLVGVENFLDKDGNEIALERVSTVVGGVTTQAVSEKFMCRLDDDTIRELSTEILGVNTLTEEDSGN